MIVRPSSVQRASVSLRSNVRLYVSGEEGRKQATPKG